jgi:hypothetical protein
MWDQSKFDAALAEYLKVTSRTVTDAINTKAYFIARKALYLTHKASKRAIQDSLGKIITSRRRMTTRIASLPSGRTADAPLAALIINARRGRAGQPGLHGIAMTRAIADLLNARMRSIAFLKSGWIPAIRILEGLAKDKSKAGPTDREARIYGRQKGGATPAAEGVAPVATIINSALSRGDPGGAALAKYGGAGLEAAFAEETASMLKYLEEKMAPDAAAANAQLA